MCPKNGLEFSRALLTRRAVSSDKEAIQLATCLRSLGQEKEAQIVEISRGRWWLQTMGNPVKATYFFMKAKDTSRFSSCCESAAWKCVSAVFNSFQGLKVHLYKQEPLRAGVFEEVVGDLVDVDRGLELLQDALLESAGILSCIGINIFDTTDNVFLDDAIFLSSPEACFLYYYTKTIVNARSFYSLTEGGIENIRITTENVLEAKDCICHMLKDVQSPSFDIPIAPMRFWLHIIELSVWLEDHYQYLLGTWPEHITRPDSHLWCLFEKEEASQLLVCMERLQTHFAVDRLTCETPTEVVLSLRLRLLQIWSNSVIQHNAELGKKLASKLQFQESSKKKGTVSEAARLITSFQYD
jgi:hypothetical protein